LQGERAQELHIEHLQSKHAGCNHRSQRERFDHVEVPAQASGGGFYLIVSQSRQLLAPPADCPELILTLTISESNKT